VAKSNVDRVNAPTLIRASGIGGHPPAKPASGRLNCWQAHRGRDEAFRVAAPCLKPSNRAASIGCDRPIVSAHEEGARRNVLKRVSIVSAELQHAAVEAKIGIRLRCFKIEVLPKGQTWRATLEEIKLERNETFVANYGWIVYEGSIRWRVSRRHRYSRV
jgi:hypothetical protein